MNTDEKFMQRCLDLAALGQGHVAPNPMVGSVVVHNNHIIGEGYHQQYGQAHAEVNAIEAVNEPELLSSSTLYVNLEPCAHFGKTPPCSDLIVRSGIPRVVIGCVDTYSEVAGKGIAKMEAAGIQIETGVLEKESRQLNRRFFTFHEKQRPYVILKWAQTQNGYMDIDRNAGEKGIFWITDPETKALVHKWRHEEAGILVGKNTVKNDNPSLTCRAYRGSSPVRFVIDQKMRLDYGRFTVGDRAVPTYILTEKQVTGSGNLQFIQPANFGPKAILASLHQLDIQSVIIEGGHTTLSHFIAANLWDEARVLTGKGKIDSGIKAPQIQGVSLASYNFGNDQINILKHD